MIARFLRDPVGWFLGVDSESSRENDTMAAQMDDAPDVPVVSDPYKPTVLDVLVVKAMLQSALNLPPEIVDNIVDSAEYWPHTSTEIDYTTRDNELRKDASGGGKDYENRFLLRTPPLGFVRSPYHDDIEKEPKPQPLEDEFEPEEFQKLIASPIPTVIHPCRKIVFTTVSHDQGWGGAGGHGTYHESWTWFEAGLERCNKKTSQKNSSDRDPQSSSEPQSTDQTDASTSTAANPPHPSFDTSNLATLSPPVVKHPHKDQLIFDHPLFAREDCKIQCNVTVNRDAKEHRVVWSYTDNLKPAPKDVPEKKEVLELENIGRGKETGDGEFVRNLKLGDIVTVWAKARFPGWTNHVDRVKVDVYWAV